MTILKILNLHLFSFFSGNFTSIIYYYYHTFYLKNIYSCTQVTILYFSFTLYSTYFPLQFLSLYSVTALFSGFIFLRHHCVLYSHNIHYFPYYIFTFCLFILLCSHSLLVLLRNEHLLP